MTLSGSKDPNRRYVPKTRITMLPIMETYILHHWVLLDPYGEFHDCSAAAVRPASPALSGAKWRLHGVSDLIELVGLKAPADLRISGSSRRSTGVCLKGS